MNKTPESESKESSSCHANVMIVIIIIKSSLTINLEPMKYPSSYSIVGIAHVIACLNNTTIHQLSVRSTKKFAY